MENIIIYPKNAKQQSLLKSLLEEMHVRFEMKSSTAETLLTEEAFFARIEQAEKQVEAGKVKKIATKEALNSFLESL